MELEETQTINISADISYIWTRFNRAWLVAGAFAGWGAGLAVLLLASFLAKDLWHPLQLIGAAVPGGGAFAGGIIHFGLSGFFGLVFAQFVWEESRKRTLLVLGTLAGIEVWLFWSMMFMPSFNEPLFFALPKLVSLGLHLVFGALFGALIAILRNRIRA